MFKILKMAVIALLVGITLSLSGVSHAKQTEHCVWCYSYYSPDGSTWCVLNGVDIESDSCFYQCQALLPGHEVPQDGGPFPFCEVNCRLTEQGVVCF